jgi:hypothetical protein
LQEQAAEEDEQTEGEDRGDLLANGGEVMSRREPATVLLEALVSALREEQRAVASLDLVRLEELTALKQELAAALVAEKVGGAQLPQAQLVALAALADANAVLLRSTTDTMREALGVDRPLGTYDAHARMRLGSGSFVVRVI